MNPQISVVLSVYNGEAFLAESIESILSQTFTDFELIIVNDGSTDKTPQIIDSFAQKDKRIQVFSFLQNMGIVRALHFGCAKVRGKYIARQDADDISSPDRLEKQINLLEQREDINLVSCQIQLVKEDKRLIVELIRIYPPEVIPWMLLFGNYIAGHGQVMFRKKDYQQVGGYNIEYSPIGEDLDLWIRLNNLGKTFILKEALYQKRKCANSIMTSQMEETINYVIKMNRESIEKVLEKDISLREVGDLLTFWSNRWNQRELCFERSELLQKNLVAIYEAYVQQKDSPQELKLKIRQTIIDRYAWWIHFFGEEAPEKIEKLKSLKAEWEKDIPLPSNDKAKLPLISVVLSVYNGEEFLAESIESVLSQTFTDFELIIINDGSTDSTPQMIDAFAQKDKRIRVFDFANNVGLLRALNFGCKKAKGKYIARQDADDISLPLRFEKEIQVLEEQSSISLVSCYLEITNERGEKLGTFRPNSKKHFIEWGILFCNYIGGHGQVLFRKKDYDEVGGYDTNGDDTSNDYELWLKLLKKGSIRILEEPLYQRRIHDKAMVTTRMEHMLAETVKLSRLAIEDLMAEPTSLASTEDLMYFWTEGWRNRLIRLENLEHIQNNMIQYYQLFVDQKNLNEAEAGEIRERVIKQYSWWYKFLDKNLYLAPIYEGKLKTYQKQWQENKLSPRHNLGKIQNYDPQIPMVSVIMILTQEEAFLKKSMESICHQSLSSLELIVLDNSSSETNKVIVREMMETDKRIRYVSKKPETHLTEMNVIAGYLARGKYLTTQGADEISFLKRLEIQTEKMEADSELVLMFGSINYMDGKDKGTLYEITGSSHAMKWHLLFGHRIIDEAQCVIRRETFKKIGGYRLLSRHNQKFDLYTRLSRKGNFQSNDSLSYKIERKDVHATERKKGYLEQIMNIQSRNFKRLLGSTMPRSEIKNLSFFWTPRLYQSKIQVPDFEGINNHLKRILKSFLDKEILEFQRQEAFQEIKSVGSYKFKQWSSLLKEKDLLTADLEQELQKKAQEWKEFTFQTFLQDSLNPEEKVKA